VSAVLLAASIASLGYLLLACARVAAFAARRCRFAGGPLLRLTVLKPLAGDEPDLYPNLASFCEQDYPGPFRIVFCIHDDDDPAHLTIERLKERYPWCSISIVSGNNAAMQNPKIANLVKPGVNLDGDLIVIADSDIRVGPRYLRALAAGFSDERVGAVTCLYSGIPNRSIVSRLGAMGIDDGFAPSVLPSGATFSSASAVWPHSAMGSPTTITSVNSSRAPAPASRYRATSSLRRFPRRGCHRCYRTSCAGRERNSLWLPPAIASRS
jgi:ceramide glucosyltransferase